MAPEGWTGLGGLTWNCGRDESQAGGPGIEAGGMGTTGHWSLKVREWRAPVLVIPSMVKSPRG